MRNQKPTFKDNHTWKIAYCERGLEQELLFESESESAACEFYLQFISSKIRHDHLVTQFREERKAIILKNWLTALGLKNYISTENFAAAPLYKVWVYDHNIFIVRHYFSVVPLEQLPETIDLLRLALARAQDFDCTAFGLRSPVSDIIPN